MSSQNKVLHRLRNTRSLDSGGLSRKLDGPSLGITDRCGCCIRDITNATVNKAALPKPLEAKAPVPTQVLTARAHAPQRDRDQNSRSFVALTPQAGLALPQDDIFEIRGEK